MKGHINAVGSLTNDLYISMTDPSRRIVQIDTLVVIIHRCETMIVLGVPLPTTRQMHVKTFFLHPISYRSISLRSAQLGGVYMSI